MDQASALMTQFIITELRKRDPALLPDGIETPDGLRQAQVAGDIKRHILEHAEARGGPELILELGQGIKGFAQAPIIQALKNSRTPNVLFQKWQRLERYGHSKNRAGISETAGNEVHIQRYAVGGPSPVVVENLMICGFLIALLELSGCRDMQCRMGREQVPVYSDGEVLQIPASLRANTDLWSLRWSAFDETVFDPASDNERAIPAVLNAGAGDIPPLISRASELVREDLGRTWKIAELAIAIGASTRTLQRRLTDAGFSFSSLVRASRIEEAGRLLTQSTLSATEIGYCCGFSDAAHFSRDFSAATGMSPSAYRDFAAAP